MLLPGATARGQRENIGSGHGRATPALGNVGDSCITQQQGALWGAELPFLSCSHCSFVLEELKFLPTDERSRDHKARCLWFLDTLIRFSHLKVIKKKSKRVFSL